MKAFSTGLPGRMKSSWTPRRYVQSSSVFERPRLKLRAVIDGARAWGCRRPEHAIQRRADRHAGHARGDLQDRTLATPLIDHSQDPKRPAIGQRVMHEVHAPALAGPGRHGRRAAV